MTAQRKPTSDDSAADSVDISLEAEEASRQDTVAADPAGESEEAAGDATADRIARVEQERDELQDRLLRTMAEFDNYRKRVAREKEDLIKYGTEKLALELLGVVDNFERALQQAGSGDDSHPLVEGVAMILKQLQGVMETFNIKGFDSVGEQFDPTRHEAMAQQEHDEYPDNQVIEEYQKGYTINDRLLRPARVIVSRVPEN